ADVNRTAAARPSAPSRSAAAGGSSGSHGQVDGASRGCDAVPRRASREAEMNRFLGALTCVAAVLGVHAPADAETPPDTLVMAMNIDDNISLDPAEVFEQGGGEVIANIYDRVTVYEPGETELSGGVAESWDISDDGHTIILHLRPGQTFHSGNPVTADDVVFSLTRVIKLNKTPTFIFSQFGWTPDDVDQMVTATDDLTVELTIPEKLAPTLVL